MEVINIASLRKRSSTNDPDAGSADSVPVVDPSISQLDTRAPRYTSYPTADRFVEAFDAGDYERHLGARALTQTGPLSLYLHIPFCESLCYYCACNKTITQNHDKAQQYLKRLVNEMDLTRRSLNGDQRLSQMHWGGGTPTFLSADEIAHLITELRSRFEFMPDGEFSIEIDPRAVEEDKVEQLAAEGFNRMSLGVQDFDPDVQKAINRIQSCELTNSVLERARKVGFESTNFDLIYGLPLQCVETFAQTMESVVDMRPERIALYNYAHLPSRFKSQRLIDETTMPSAEEKQAIFEMANEKLDAAGYEYIGMDHFALPNDELAVAHRSGRLHRNFQGYATQPDCDLIALGASAISRVGSCYAQNVRGVNDYCDLIDKGVLPIQRGLELSSDDVLRRAVIMAIMCQGYLDKTSFEVSYRIVFDDYFSVELNALIEYEQLGLVELFDNAVSVTALGRRKALRIIGAVFDQHLRKSQERSRFSRVL